MILTDAAISLSQKPETLLQALKTGGYLYTKVNPHLYFEHETARNLFKLKFKPQIVAFQIVKGGTGKTSLAYECAIRASLYGARVLCVDMDQQGNLTQAFQVDAEQHPVMIDILADHLSLEDSLVSVAPGIDLIPSRFENSLLDEILRIKEYPLEAVYREPLQALKANYDLIILDCPPTLGASVAACALASDCLISPVTPDKFALLGVEMTYQSLLELEESFGISIQLGLILNKFESRTTLSQEALRTLTTDPRFKGRFLNCVRASQEFPKSHSGNRSIFDSLKTTGAKADIDALTRALLAISKDSLKSLEKRVSKKKKVHESLAYMD